VNHIHLTPKLIADIVVYWGFFWNAIYFIAPPRETFNSPNYNKFLDLVSYYGALNIRSLFMRLYGAAPTNPPATINGTVQQNSTATKVDGAPPKA
jgi:hypothetical protein